MKKSCIIILVLATILNGERANKNRIEKEATIKHWSYVGPIQNKEDHDKILNIILEKGLSTGPYFEYEGKEYQIRDASANNIGNLVHQLYPEIKKKV